VTVRSPTVQTITNGGGANPNPRVARVYRIRSPMAAKDDKSPTVATRADKYPTDAKADIRPKNSDARSSATARTPSAPALPACWAGW